MGEQVADRDQVGVIIWRATGYECRDESFEWLIKVELIALPQQHGSGRCGDDFGDAGKIKDGIGGDCGRVFIVGEAAQGVLKDNFAVCQDTKGAARESMGGHSIAEDAVSGLEANRRRLDFSVHC